MEQQVYETISSTVMSALLSDFDELCPPPLRVKIPKPRHLEVIFTQPAHWLVTLAEINKSPKPPNPWINLSAVFSSVVISQVYEMNRLARLFPQSVNTLLENAGTMMQDFEDGCGITTILEQLQRLAKWLELNGHKVPFPGPHPDWNRVFNPSEIAIAGSLFYQSASLFSNDLAVQMQKSGANLLDRSMNAR